MRELVCPIIIHSVRPHLFEMFFRDNLSYLMTVPGDPGQKEVTCLNK